MLCGRDVQWLWAAERRHRLVEARARVAARRAVVVPRPRQPAPANV